MKHNCLLVFLFLWGIQATAVNGYKLFTAEENIRLENDTVKYRLVVSFFSKASGIDKKAQEEFEKLLTGHNPEIRFEKTRWGREGETDYCLTLSDLSKRKQKKVVKKVRKTLKNSTLVAIREFSPCVHKR